MEVPEITIKREKVNLTLATEPNVIDFEPPIINSRKTELDSIKMEPGSDVSEADNIDEDLKLLDDDIMIGNDDKYMLDSPMNLAQNIVSMELLEGNKNQREDIRDDYDYLLAEEINDGVILPIDQDNYLSDIPNLSLEDNGLSDSVSFPPEDDLKFDDSNNQVSFSDQLFAISEFNFGCGSQGKLVPYSSSSSDSDVESKSIFGGPSLIFNPNYGQLSSLPSFSGDVERGKPKKRKLSAKEENTRRRRLGLKYKNSKGKIVPLKTPRPNPCEGKRCTNACNLFSPEERQEICRAFWKLGDWKSQKSYLSDCVLVIPVKRKRTKNDESRRSCTYEHYLIKQNKQVRVCQQFLTATLGITQKVIRNSIKDKVVMCDNDPSKPETNDSQRQCLNEFIEKLPTVHSINSKGSLSKLYLPAEAISFANVYEMYATDNNDKIGAGSFKKILEKDFNIGIHIPMKGRCFKCERYKRLPENLKNKKEEVDYLTHIKQKIDGKDYFLKTQKNPGTSTTVASFDLQKVLTTPHGSSASLAYARKYYCYNFTICESGSSKGVCYFWGEKDGKRGANEICSHVFAYLSQLDRGKNERVHLFCDETPRLFKNLHMMAMLSYFLSVSRVIRSIIITFLVPGHTYMPVDRIHAEIEKKVKKMFIQAPSEWPTVLRNAHKQTHEILVTKHSSVLNWESLIPSEGLKDRDGNDIKLSGLYEISFDKNSTHVHVKTSYSAKGTQAKVPFRLNTVKEVPKAYDAELPINKKKYDNLVELCRSGVIEPQYHAEYFPLKVEDNVPDALPETDIEDVEF